MRDSDAVLLVTRWHEFAALPEVLAGLGADPVVVDGRRMLDAGSVRALRRDRTMRAPRRIRTGDRR